ncbi:hypothetical protein [Paenibacillus sp. Pae108]|uniref:hypothetical protein n=1 Tax=Paenibacillus sp. Pae108 TaxID=2926019 RepID=UPI00211862C7|nr:hypothetical protein [Paenibacillus sp. Pae108]
MTIKKKFRLEHEFDEAPALVFIQEKVGSGFRLYQDGKEVEGIRSIHIDAVEVTVEGYDAPG